MTNIKGEEKHASLRSGKLFNFQSNTTGLRTKSIINTLFEAAVTEFCSRYRLRAQEKKLTWRLLSLYTTCFGILVYKTIWEKECRYVDRAPE